MTAPPDAATALVRINSLSDDEVRGLLLACCGSSAWVERVLAGRPYAAVRELLAAADDACRQLSDEDVTEALAAHPRIGDRAEGAQTEARWSRQEQSSVADADQGVKDALREGNLRYEDQFNRVFLIRAAGRTPAEMLAELERRLRNDPATERREVHEQLCQITRLRVQRLVTS